VSKNFLYELNGSNHGAFLEWLDAFQGEPRIAWYPSAGQDFRDLLYLNPQYAEKNPALQPDPLPPDIFLHTDYFPWSSSTFLETATVHLDERSSVTVKTMEELPRCDLPLTEAIVDFPEGGIATGRVLFLEIEFQSHIFGTFTRPVVYAFAENAAFCAKRILPLKARLSHIVHVRFGGGCGGGGQSNGAWLLNVLRRVGCEVFISDESISVANGNPGKRAADKQIYALYPELSGSEDVSQLILIRTIPSESWSGHGNVSWNLMPQPALNRQTNDYQP